MAASLRMPSRPFGVRPASPVLAASGEFNRAADWQATWRLAPDDHAQRRNSLDLSDAGDADVSAAGRGAGGRYPEADSVYYMHSAVIQGGRRKREQRKMCGKPPACEAQNSGEAVDCPTPHCALAALGHRFAQSRDPATYVNLGTIYLESETPAAAADIFTGRCRSTRHRRSRRTRTGQGALASSQDSKDRRRTKM